MTTIYLLRHGATALNREVPYRLQGRKIDPPLDELGRRQAEAAAGALASTPIVAVYSSPLRRAVETAAIVGGPHGLAPSTIDALTEADLGRWEGLTWDEARAIDPRLVEEFQRRPGVTPYPGGESFGEVAARALPALAEVGSRHESAHVVVVAHNVVNRAVLAALLGLDMDRARSIRQANCGINVLRYEGGRGEVESMNASLHLGGRALL